MTDRMTETFTPVIILRPLARTVLVVAKTRIDDEWAAYCTAVPGENHQREAGEVLDRGSKLDERVARAIFPEFDGVDYAP